MKKNDDDEIIHQQTIQLIQQQINDDNIHH